MEKDGMEMGMIQEVKSIKLNNKDITKKNNNKKKGGCC